MRVAGCNYGLVVFFAQLNDPAVEIAKILLVLCLFLSYKESVVGNRLNFKIIVEIDDLLYLCLGTVLTLVSS